MRRSHLLSNALNTVRSEDVPGRIATLLAGVGVGAAAAFLFDPRSGRRRRALLNDRLAHVQAKMDDLPRIVGRDLVHRASGLWAEGTRWLHDRSITDETLAARARAKLGRIVSHPHAVKTIARDGCITLSGPILLREVDPLLRAIRGIPGVREVQNQLFVYERPQNISALQGGRHRVGERFELMQDSWSPSTRMLAGCMGTGLAAGGLRAGGVAGAVSAIAGLALVLRAATNRDMRSLFGVGQARRGFEIHKTVHVAAPVERVFAFWSDFENFPRFMSRVREVIVLDELTSRWTVSGPAGVPVHWTALVTRCVPNALIEWCTEPGSGVQHHGSARFDVGADGLTRVQIQLRYFPPAGAFGHALAAFLCADPKTEIDEDLMRMKSMIETGHRPHDAAQADFGDSRARREPVVRPASVDPTEPDR